MGSPPNWGRCLRKAGQRGHTAAGGFVHRRVELVETFIDSTHVEGFAPVGVDLFDKIRINIKDERADGSVYR